MIQERAMKQQKSKSDLSSVFSPVCHTTQQRRKGRGVRDGGIEAEIGSLYGKISQRAQKKDKEGERKSRCYERKSFFLCCKPGPLRINVFMRGRQRKRASVPPL